MNTSNDDSNNMRIRLAVMEEKQKHIQEIILRQEKELKETHFTLGIGRANGKL
jgi:hypothetical protein